MVHTAATAPGPAHASRREIVERVLATADALERAACARAAAPRLVLETRSGCVAVEGRLCALVGRGARCDVPLSGGRVSRRHAALVQRGGAWWIEDLGSLHGTFCRGERVERRRLCDGDVLELGDEPVRCRLHA
ncbi:MAG TPA: FHA domain-containing protein [Anaeromyxobacteraceae bacterium]|nr:FHA domain-containing protein [Anaeromyxobacteraceae bacterium]